jgi:hypothetical protein
VTGWLIAFAYVAVGVITYIRMVPVCYRRRLAKEKESYRDLGEQWARESAPIMAGWRAALWPYAVFHELVARRINAYAWRPVEVEAERRKRLQQDREDWRGRSYDQSLPPDQRRMAADIVTTLDDILRREAS